ncbi:hypothetical protein RI129_003332 [Pyrocoelia pectoralis]|uniref:Uncharacterized protein n=1 Tax=Pyrocoelia pectoralis TaxID=417401 RepID=A0AAN7ZIJ5_9COLE
MHSIKFFVMLMAVEILCESKQLQQGSVASSENRTSGPVDTIKSALNAHKKECVSSKEEKVNPKSANSRDDFKNNKKSDNQNFHTSTYMDRYPYRDYNYDHDFISERGGHVPDPYATRVGYGAGYIRSKRDEDDADYIDSQCLTQCLFEYLGVLDENQSPSEFALIKWIQDNTPQNEKRIKAIREVRRCFGQIAASDNGDGCNFSKSLLKCLNIEIEE